MKGCLQLVVIIQIVVVFHEYMLNKKNALVGGQDPVFLPWNLATPLHACHVGSPFSKNPRHLPNSILSHDFKPRSSHVFLSNWTAIFGYIMIYPISGQTQWSPTYTWILAPHTCMGYPQKLPSITTIYIYIVIQVITHLNSWKHPKIQKKKTHKTHHFPHISGTFRGVFFVSVPGDTSEGSAMPAPCISWETAACRRPWPWRRGKNQRYRHYGIFYDHPIYHIYIYIYVQYICIIYVCMYICMYMYICIIFVYMYIYIYMYMYICIYMCICVYVC